MYFLLVDGSPNAACIAGPFKSMAQVLNSRLAKDGMQVNRVTRKLKVTSWKLQARSEGLYAFQAK